MHPFFVSVGFVGEVVGVLGVEVVVGESVIAEGVAGEEGVDGGDVAGGYGGDCGLGVEEVSIFAV